MLHWQAINSVVPTEQAVKTYVDGEIAGVSGGGGGGGNALVTLWCKVNPSWCRSSPDNLEFIAGDIAINTHATNDSVTFVTIAGA